ncbi:PE domain-containing protein [Amycolatopsis panacis]|uniref:PE domain-containing protein n=1 Tax=Amycolatopsis panacis TaxID=2340917 RepID=A0A419IAH0_9PSEU|nr:PE domain-containing protein [Amycolatopsis panacis]RJQ90676.1 PE domain-containing protein [Amycolatopsis panacis]
MTDDAVERVRHLPADMQGPLVPGYKYVRDKTPEQAAQEAADAQAKANEGMASGGGGYRLTPELLTELVTEIDDILAWIRTDVRRHAEQLVSFKPMGDEVASIAYVEDANAAGRSYKNFLDSFVAELTRQRDAFHQALDTYQKQEARAADHLKGLRPHDD